MSNWKAWTDAETKCGATPRVTLALLLILAAQFAELLAAEYRAAARMVQS